MKITEQDSMTEKEFRDNYIVGDNLAVYLPTQELFNNFLEQLDKLNILWAEGQKASNLAHYWDKHKTRTCVRVSDWDYTHYITYNNYHFYMDRGSTIVLYEMEEII